MTFKLLPQANAGTSSKFAANDINKIVKWISNTDIIALDATDTPILNTLTRIRNGKLALLVPNYPTNTFYTTLESSQVTANRKATIPLLTSDQEILTMDHAQTPTQKTWGLNTNTFTDTAATTGGIPSHDGTKYRD